MGGGGGGGSREREDVDTRTPCLDEVVVPMATQPYMKSRSGPAHMHVPSEENLAGEAEQGVSLREMAHTLEFFMRVLMVCMGHGGGGGVQGTGGGGGRGR